MITWQANKKCAFENQFYCRVPRKLLSPISVIIQVNSYFSVHCYIILTKKSRLYCFPLLKFNGNFQFLNKRKYINVITYTCVTKDKAELYFLKK